MWWTVCLFLLAPSLATILHTSPNATRLSPPCTIAAPCALPAALHNAHAGDIVQCAFGEYRVPAGVGQVASGVEIDGRGSTWRAENTAQRTGEILLF